MVCKFGDTAERGGTHTTAYQDDMFILADVLSGSTVRSTNVYVDVVVVAVAFLEECMKFAGPVSIDLDEEEHLGFVWRGRNSEWMPLVVADQWNLDITILTREVREGAGNSQTYDIGLICISRLPRYGKAASLLPQQT